MCRQASLLHPSFRRAPGEGTAGLRNPASRDPVWERGDQVFGEPTRETAGSDDFVNDDFFPDLGNFILDDMGDSVNASGAAPAAPYVILSFMFEIMVEFMFLVCALDVICSSAMLVRMISLIFAIVVMTYFLFVRIKSRSNLLIFPTSTPIRHSTSVSTRGGRNAAAIEAAPGTFLPSSLTPGAAARRLVFFL